jgi:hypothetical protein
MKNGSLIAILYRLFRQETVLSTFGFVDGLFCRDSEIFVLSDRHISSHYSVIYSQ